MAVNLCGFSSAIRGEAKNSVPHKIKPKMNWKRLRKLIEEVMIEDPISRLCPCDVLSFVKNVIQVNHSAVKLSTGKTIDVHKNVGRFFQIAKI